MLDIDLESIPWLVARVTEAAANETGNGSDVPAHSCEWDE
jgi:hypothetical protein